VNFPLFPPVPDRGATPARPERDVYTVSRLNKEVRLLLESGLPMLWLEGELSKADLYNRDPARFAAASGDLARARAERDTAEEEWLRLEMLRESLERR